MATLLDRDPQREVEEHIDKHSWGWGPFSEDRVGRSKATVSIKRRGSTQKARFTRVNIEIVPVKETGWGHKGLWRHQGWGWDWNT